MTTKRKCQVQGCAFLGVMAGGFCKSHKKLDLNPNYKSRPGQRPLPSGKCDTQGCLLDHISGSKWCNHHRNARRCELQNAKYLAKKSGIVLEKPKAISQEEPASRNPWKGALKMGLRLSPQALEVAKLGSSRGEIQTISRTIRGSGYSGD